MKPERFIPLIYRHEAILQNENIARLNRISSACLQQQRIFKELYPPDDTRHWTFQKIAQILAYYRLTLCFSFGILSRTDNMGKILEPGKTLKISAERAGLILGEYEQYITFSFFHAVFSSIESSLRSIVGKVPVPNNRGIPCKDTDKISDIYHGLINYSGVDEKYRDLFDLLLMVRNCIHNRSIYFSDKGSKSMEYNGKTYDFIQGKPIGFATVDFFFDLLFDVSKFFQELFHSERLKEEPYIPDRIL